MNVDLRTQPLNWSMMLLCAKTRVIQNSFHPGADLLMLRWKTVIQLDVN